MNYLDNIIKSCKRISEEFQEFEKGIKQMSDFYNAESEPDQPIIKKSGETWVARFDGVDYLKTIPCLTEVTLPAFFYHETKDIVSDWKPFTKLEITDEIAKLRPVVAGKGVNVIDTLIYVKENHGWPYVVKDCGSWNTCRLATIDDLP